MCRVGIYSDKDKIAMNIGFYYMANAGGRLIGTVLSRLTYQFFGIIGCLWLSSAFLLVAGFTITLLSVPEHKTTNQDGDSTSDLPSGLTTIAT